jgi:hypothetical protein
MSDEKKISDDELVEIAGGGVVIELDEGGGIALEPQQDIIGTKPIDEEEGGSLDRD